MEIAFIGLGNMGAPMASNLAAAGHKVRGFSIDALPTTGVGIVGSIQDCVAEADVIYTMLPNAAIVGSVYHTALEHARKGALFIDSSTIDVASANALAERAMGQGFDAVDAPVSGGIAAAAAGSLTMMVGGTDAGFERAEPILSVVGARVIHCGGNGMGQATKICNNMLLGVTMAGTCETIALADRLGLNRQVLYDVVSTASGSCWSMNTYSPMPGVGPKTPADNNYEPGFSAGLMLKDLRLSQEAAVSKDAQTPMAALATRLYTDFVETDGRGDKDFSALLPKYVDDNAS